MSAEDKTISLLIEVYREKINTARAIIRVVADPNKRKLLNNIIDGKEEELNQLEKETLAYKGKPFVNDLIQNINNLNPDINLK